MCTNLNHAIALPVPATSRAQLNEEQVRASKLRSELAALSSGHLREQQDKSGLLAEALARLQVRPGEGGRATYRAGGVGYSRLRPAAGTTCRCDMNAIPPSVIEHSLPGSNSASSSFLFPSAKWRRRRRAASWRRSRRPRR